MIEISQCMSNSKLIDILARTTFDFLASNGELEHNSAVLALFFANLRRGNFVDCLAPTALDLLGACDKFKHRPTVVADQVRAGHWWDTSCDRKFPVRQVHQQVLVLGSNLVAFQLHGCKFVFCHLFPEYLIFKNYKPIINGQMGFWGFGVLGFWGFGFRV